MADILVVTPEFPWPCDSGVKIREYQTLSALSERHSVSLISLVSSDPTSAPEGLDQLDLETIHTVPHDRSKHDALVRFATSRDPYRIAKFRNSIFSDRIESIIKEHSFDLIFVHFLNTLVDLPDTLDMPVVLDQHNAERRYWESFKSGGPLRWTFATLNNQRLKRLQNKYASVVDLVWSVDESDADAARSWVNAPVEVVPNGVTLSKFTAAKMPNETDPIVLFVGSLDVEMNVEAVCWFASEAWPTVREAVPEARFRVVGRNPTEQVRELDKKAGITVVGEVDEVVPEYERASVFVAPFEFGGGTKLKILETLSMKRPLVSTQTGVKGINISDGTEAIITNRDGSFPAAVIKLLNDPDTRLRMGEAGRDHVRENYSWKEILEDAIAGLGNEFDLT